MSYQGDELETKMRSVRLLWPLALSITNNYTDLPISHSHPQNNSNGPPARASDIGRVLVDFEHYYAYRNRIGNPILCAALAGNRGLWNQTQELPSTGSSSDRSWGHQSTRR